MEYKYRDSTREYIRVTTHKVFGSEETWEDDPDNKWTEIMPKFCSLIVEQFDWHISRNCFRL